MRTDRIRAVAYWTFTLLVAFENAAGSMWVFAPHIPGVNRLHATVVFAEYLHWMLAHLGYPPYFEYLLGPWQFACAAALLAPGLPRAKEWAYAGAFINYVSAFASHLFVGDRPDVGSAMIALFAVLSWALRPGERRLADATSSNRFKALSWISAGAILLLLLILSFSWLPQIPDVTH